MTSATSGTVTTKLFKKRKASTKTYRYGNIPGVAVGRVCKNRKECNELGLHGPTQAGIHGNVTTGAYSVVLSGGYEDDEDNGETFTYTGEGGRKGANGPQIKDQDWKNNNNKALKISCARNSKVRVIRGHTLDSRFAPVKGYRYDGIYRVVKAEQTQGKSGFKLCRFRFRRDPGQPPIPVRTSAKGSRVSKGRAYDNSSDVSYESDSSPVASSDHENKMEGSSKMGGSLFSASSSSPSPGPEPTAKAGQKRKRVSGVLRVSSDSDSDLRTSKKPKCRGLDSTQAPRAVSLTPSVKSEEIEQILPAPRLPLHNRNEGVGPSLPRSKKKPVKMETKVPVADQDDDRLQTILGGEKLKELNLGRIPKRKKLTPPQNSKAEKIATLNDDGDDMNDVRDVGGDSRRDHDHDQPGQDFASQENSKYEPSFTYRGLLPSFSTAAPSGVAEAIRERASSELEEGEINEAEEAENVEKKREVEGQVKANGKEGVGGGQQGVGDRQEGVGDEQGGLGNGQEELDDEQEAEVKGKEDEQREDGKEGEQVEDGEEGEWEESAVAASLQTTESDQAFSTLVPSGNGEEEGQPTTTEVERLVVLSHEGQHGTGGTQNDGKESEIASRSTSNPETAVTSANATPPTELVEELRALSVRDSSTPSLFPTVWARLPKHESVVDWTNFRDELRRISLMEVALQTRNMFWTG